MNTDDIEQNGMDKDDVSRRKTVHNLERTNKSKQNVINLDANFKRRITMLQKQDPGEKLFLLSEKFVLSRLSRRHRLKFCRMLNIHGMRVRMDHMLGRSHLVG